MSAEDEASGDAGTPQEKLVAYAQRLCSTGNGTAEIKAEGVFFFDAMSVVVSDGLVFCVQADGEDISFPLASLQAVRTTRRSGLPVRDINDD